MHFALAYVTYLLLHRTKKGHHVGDVFDPNLDRKYLKGPPQIQLLPSTVAVKLVFCFVAGKFNCSKLPAWLKLRHLINLRRFKCAGRRKRGASAGEDNGMRLGL